MEDHAAIQTTRNNVRDEELESETEEGETDESGTGESESEESESEDSEAEDSEADDSEADDGGSGIDESETEESETDESGTEECEAEELSETEECELLARRKHIQKKKLKNLRAPVHRLPIEILQSCFYRALQDWLCEYDRAEQISAGVLREVDGPQYRPRSPVIVVSHVSHHWRQLAINMPSLWTNISITPNLEHRMDVFREFLCRAKSMPIALRFRGFFLEPDVWPPTRFNIELAEIKAIIPPLQARQISSLTFSHSGTMFGYLFFRVTVQPLSSTPSPLVFSSLTALSFIKDSRERFYLEYVQKFLHLTPKLESLELELRGYSSDDYDTDQTIITLPSLKKLTLTHSYPRIIDYLSIPALQHLELLDWYPDTATDCLLNDGLPRFPTVQNLTLHINKWLNPTYTLEQYRKIISAFPRVTHLTLRSPGTFTSLQWEEKSPPIAYWPSLQHVTLHFEFVAIKDRSTLHSRFSWLPRREDRTRPLLHICVLDATKKRNKRRDKNLFCCYKELQKYGTLEGTMLDNFLRAEPYFSEFTVFRGRRFDQLWHSERNPYYL